HGLEFTPLSGTLTASAFLRLKVGRLSVFGLNFGAVRLEPWYEPGRADHFYNVAGLLAGALQFVGDDDEVGRLPPCSRRSKRHIVGRFGLEAPHCETLRRFCAS